jgi:hypothetical protein
MDTFLIFFFNGVFLEFGDELFCMILAEPTGFGSFQSCHNAAARAIAFGAENSTFFALAGGIMGYAFAPTYYVYVSMNGPPKTAGETFKVLFLVEAFEGAASVVGQLATDGNLGTALIPLLFILPIGFAKGAIFAFIFAWKTSELFKFQVILVLGIVLAIAYYGMGGGELIKSEIVHPTNRATSGRVEKHSNSEASGNSNFNYSYFGGWNNVEISGVKGYVALVEVEDDDLTFLFVAHTHHIQYSKYYDGSFCVGDFKNYFVLNPKDEKKWLWIQLPNFDPSFSPRYSHVVLQRIEGDVRKPESIVIREHVFFSVSKIINC